MTESEEPSLEEFDEDEIKVADILLNLRNIIAKSEARRHWGAKRKRTALVSPPSPSPSPPQRRGKAMVGVENWSPATPLSFSPSESDEKHKHSHNKAFKKRTKEELLETIESLSKGKTVLIGEVEKVKRHYEDLLATNSALKQQLNFWHEKRVQTQLGTSTETKNLGFELGQDTLKAVEKQRQDQRPQQHVVVHHHQQPLILNQTVYGVSSMGEKIQCTRDQIFQLFSSGSRMVVPHGQHNLNMPAKESLVMECSQPLDLARVVMNKRGVTAEARRYRTKIRREKKLKEKCINLVRF